MFVRFRQTARRLQASLIATRRSGGKVRHEHIASLGSVPLSPSAADRAAFWIKLHQRLGALGNGEPVGGVPPLPSRKEFLQRNGWTEVDARHFENLVRFYELSGYDVFETAEYKAAVERGKKAVERAVARKVLANLSTIER